MTAEIVRAGEEHIPGILAVEKACFSRPWSEESLRGEMENGRSAVFTALAGGTVVGWAGLSWVLDEGSVSDIAVTEAFRRQGIGRALTRALLEECHRRGLRCLLLEARVSNEPAIQLYRSLGFYPVGRRPRFYEAPREDALLMRADIPEE